MDNMTFQEGMNTSINILQHMATTIEDQLAGNPNIGEIAKLLEEIGGGWGRIQELLGEGNETIAPPGQPTPPPAE